MQYVITQLRIVVRWAVGPNRSLWGYLNRGAWEDACWEDRYTEEDAVIINIEIDGAFADEEMRSLYDWLLNEPTIRHNAKVEMGAQGPKEGEMGTALDIIALFVTGGLQLPSFIQVLLDWRETRRREYPVTVELNGARVVVPAAGEDLVLKVVRELESKPDAS
ncbi:effector-associated constant component EACC1 [Actinomadura nitritigenes]|uniref:effector-associated constant component EACC1 n=1 Tax=Actinomadura nitritigenes TaxID=134602 RepID=UPI003D8E892C